MIITDLERVAEKIRAEYSPGFINLLFVGYLILFLTDNIINHYIYLPVFVAGAMVLTIFLLPFAMVHIRRDAWLAGGLLLLMVIMGINSLKDGFGVKNVSDYLFLALFLISYMAYSSSAGQLKRRYAFAFMAGSVVLLLLPSALMAIGIDPCLTAYETEGIPVEQLGKAIVRHYNRGFFRLPHVASYFFGFSSVFILHMAQRERNYFWLAAGLILLFLSLYTGARAFVVALIVSLILFLVQKRKFGWLLAVMVGCIVVFVFRNTIFNLLEGIFLQQHFALIISFAEDLDSFSRIVVWKILLNEVLGFDWYEVLIGRSYVSGLATTQGHLGVAIWFHNDFLSIFYSYGLVGLIFYVSFLARIYLDHRKYITGNLYIFAFYYASIVLAVTNGFYYYFPVLLLYLFFLMINNEEQRQVSGVIQESNTGSND